MRQILIQLSPKKNDATMADNESFTPADLENVGQGPIYKE